MAIALTCRCCGQPPLLLGDGSEVDAPPDVLAVSLEDAVLAALGTVLWQPASATQLAATRYPTILGTAAAYERGRPTEWRHAEPDGVCSVAVSADTADMQPHEPRMPSWQAPAGQQQTNPWQQPAAPYQPPAVSPHPERPKVSTGHTVLLWLILLLLVANLCFTFYVWRVTYDLVQLGHSVSSLFGGS